MVDKDLSSSSYGQRFDVIGISPAVFRGGMKDGCSVNDVVESDTSLGGEHVKIVREKLRMIHQNFAAEQSET